MKMKYNDIREWISDGINSGLFDGAIRYNVRSVIKEQLKIAIKKNNLGSIKDITNEELELMKDEIKNEINESWKKKLRSL